MRKPMKTYGDVNPVFDHIISHFNLKNDAELARRLELDGPALSKARTKGLLYAGMYINVHETFDLPMDEIKRLANPLAVAA